jgi:hypothetical protein
MDEARRLLARLDRVESLDREGAHPGVLLAELRALIAEAEAWTRAERTVPEEAAEAVARCRKRLEDAGRTLVA